MVWFGHFQFTFWSVTRQPDGGCQYKRFASRREKQKTETMFEGNDVMSNEHTISTAKKVTEAFLCTFLYTQKRLVKHVETLIHSCRDRSIALPCAYHK